MSAASDRHSLPLGAIRPCAPTRVLRPPSGDGWTHEVKADGYRIIARRDAGEVRLLSRPGRDWTRAFPRIARALGSLPRDVILDGEAIVLDANGHPDFHALRGRERRNALLLAFDCLAADGVDLRRAPIEERRGVLRNALRTAPDGLRLMEPFRGDGAAIFAHACALGLEGIVSKRAGSHYTCGPSLAWLKTLNPAYSRTRSAN